VTDSQHELEELRQSLADDATQRAKLLAGLGDALAKHDAEDSGPRSAMLEAAESPEESTRGGLLASLIATGALLYIPPAIAARVMLGQNGTGSPEPCEVIVVVLCP
jgi:hypothetical protein